MSSLGRILHYRMVPVNSAAGRGITHAVDEQPEKASRPKRKRKAKRQARAAENAPARRTEPNPKQICGLCGERIARGDMRRHFKRHHPNHKPRRIHPKTACPCCAAQVRVDRIEGHLRTVHPEAKAALRALR